jgi:hypothetical protein
VGRGGGTIAAHPLTVSMLLTPAVATPSWVRSLTRGGSLGGRSDRVCGCACVARVITVRCPSPVRLPMLTCP